MKVAVKKELVPKRNNDGMWIEVIYFLGKEVVQKDYYNLSNEPEFINKLVEKNRLNIESNLLTLD